MSQTSPKIKDRISPLFSIHKLRLFHQHGDYVACFGEPAMADDGWVINLPAANFFTGDYHNLPFDVDIQAAWAHAQTAIMQPLASYISVKPSSAPWESKAAALGIPNYGHADLFRDLSSLLISHNQSGLALSFIQVAHQLRPDGPAIRQLLSQLTYQSDSSGS